MNALAKDLPNKIADARKNLSKEDALKLDNAIKQLNVDEKLREFQNMPNNFESFMKKNYAS